MILEQIFDELAKSPVSALLNCRLVSHRWLSFAMKPLEKLVHLKLFSNKPTCLNSLTQLLQQPNTFPAIKFSFFNRNIHTDEIFTSFLTTYGVNITELLLSHFTDWPHESVLMEQMETLLSLTPNLLELTLIAPSTVSWENGGEGRSSCSELFSSDPEFRQILQRCSTKTRNTSLKFVHLYDVSAKVIETILQMSPNVEKVSSDVFLKVHLLQPVTRVHLIRDLFICPIFEYVEKLERIALAYEQETTTRPRLEHMEISLADETFGRFWPDFPEMHERAVSVVSRVLKICSCCLQTIKWNGLMILHRQGNGIKWPKLLPHLWKLELEHPLTDLSSDENGLFPSETNLAAMCPELRFVAFDFSTCQNISDKTNVERLLNALNFDPVESVQEIKIKNISDSIVLSEARKHLATLFPNARVK